MAVIDFSHATITAKTGQPWGNANLGFDTDPNDSGYISRGSHSINAVSQKKREYNYMGTVGSTNNKIILGGSGLHPELATWEIGGISYHSGDTYSFTIEVELP